MPRPSKGPRLGGSPAHERLMLANLATSLFTHGRITTTETKAKRLRPIAERLITKAKRGDLHNRRQVMSVIRDKDVVHRLFADIGPFFADRNGGYTRIVKTMPRKGDNAPMAVIELVSQRTASAEATQAARVGAKSAPAASPAAPVEAPAASPETPAGAAESPAAPVEAPVSEVAESAVTEDTPSGEGSRVAPVDGSQREDADS